MGDYYYKILFTISIIWNSRNLLASGSTYSFWKHVLYIISAIPSWLLLKENPSTDAPASDGRVKDGWKCAHGAMMAACQYYETKKVDNELIHTGYNNNLQQVDVVTLPCLPPARAAGYRRRLF